MAGSNVVQSAGADCRHARTGQTIPVDTIGITTVHRFSIVPVLNAGQTELYSGDAVVRHGAASRVSQSIFHRYVGSGLQADLTRSC